MLQNDGALVEAGFLQPPGPRNPDVQSLRQRFKMLGPDVHLLRVGLEIGHLREVRRPLAIMPSKASHRHEGINLVVCLPRERRFQVAGRVDRFRIGEGPFQHLLNAPVAIDDDLAVLHQVGKHRTEHDLVAHALFTVGHNRLTRRAVPLGQAAVGLEFPFRGHDAARIEACGVVNLETLFPLSEFKMGKALVPQRVAVIGVHGQRPVAPQLAQRRLASVDVQRTDAVQRERLVLVHAFGRVLLGFGQRLVVVLKRLLVVVLLLVGSSNVEIGSGTERTA